MIVRHILALSCAVIMLQGSLLYAREYTVPERLFQMTGAQVNTTQADLLYKSQAAGYYTGGGGMVVRAPVKNTKLMNINLGDKFDAGCGGIDIFTGGISFISGDQIVDTLKVISSNAAGFSFMLGVEALSPSGANAMRQLQSWANTMNQIGINSCETAAALVGSVWPADDMARQHICRTVNASKGSANDYLIGRHKCTEESFKTESINQVNPMGSEYNIAWEALKLQPYFKNGQNLEMAELYMSLVGTFIIRKNEQPTFHFSKIGDGEFLQGILEGGSIKKYKCNEPEKCLFVSEATIAISSNNSWFAKTKSLISSMHYKATVDEPLDASEKALLNTSRLPLHKFVNVLSAHHRGKPFAADLDNLADIVTWDAFVQLANEAIETVRRGCIDLRENSMFGTDITRYLADLDHVRKELRRYEEHLQKGIDLEMRLIKKMQLLEEELNSQIMVY